MNEKDILDLEKSFDVLKTSINLNNPKDRLAFSLSNSIDDVLLEWGDIVYKIEHKKMSQIESSDFRKLSKVFDIMWDLYKFCIKNGPEFIDRISEESKYVWSRARDIAHTFYENKVKIHPDRSSYKLASDTSKVDLLEELKIYLTNEEKENVIKLLEEVKNKKVSKSTVCNQWMADDKYCYWLTDV
jgi:hypothetical protein